MTHLQMSRRGGLSKSEKKRQACLKTIEKAREALREKRLRAKAAA